MKKKNAILVVLAITGIFLVCSLVFANINSKSNNMPSVKDTPVRIGKNGEIHALYGFLSLILAFSNIYTALIVLSVSRFINVLVWPIFQMT